MVIAERLSLFYKDLHDERAESALALVHARFSTNTFPTWELAHPFRYLAHNGEINTLRGNINWMMARRHSMTSKLFGDDLDKLWPLIGDGNSDSATLDNCLELLVAGGYPLPHALMMLSPGSVVGEPADGSRPARFLRISRGADGAVGRPGSARFHRRPPDRRDARPQRPAPGALPRHR